MAFTRCLVTVHTAGIEEPPEYSGGNVPTPDILSCNFGKSMLLGHFSLEAFSRRANTGPQDLPYHLRG